MDISLLQSVPQKQNHCCRCFELTLSCIRMVAMIT